VWSHANCLSDPLVCYCCLGRLTLRTGSFACMGSVFSTLGPLGSGSDTAQALLQYPRSRWEGWGCSLAWSGKVMGASSDVEAWADLFFSMGELSMSSLWPGRQGPPVPCLGMNLVRYNIGGVGNVQRERRSKKSRGWHAEVEGFQPEEHGAFDWERDVEQRKILALAVERGVDAVELFSNAPMWWMMDSRSSFGGYLANADAFVNYLAEVTNHARSEWHTPVVALSPFNEPSAGWWKYPKDQEGCNIPVDSQESILLKLRGELDTRGLEDVILSASDENTCEAALRSWEKLRGGAARDCVGRLNCHGYDGLRPWSESWHPGVRRKLSLLARSDDLPVWMSEYGCSDTSGMVLAQSILEDMHHLKPTGWCYWQVLEHKCSWGLVEASFSDSGASEVSPPNAKYYVFAHFTRFLRPGLEMLHCTEPWALVGRSREDATLACVFVNKGSSSRRFSLAFPMFKAAEERPETVVSEPHLERFFVKSRAVCVRSDDENGFELHVEVPADAICSVKVALAPSAAVTRVTAAEVVELGRLATKAAMLELDSEYGVCHKFTEESWAYFEHVLASAVDDVEEAPPIFDRTRWYIERCAWGVANERKLGKNHGETKQCWQDFHAEKDRVGDDLHWALFNACWAVGNHHSYGDDEGAEEKALKLLSSVGPDTPVVTIVRESVRAAEARV